MEIFKLQCHKTLKFFCTILDINYCLVGVLAFCSHCCFLVDSWALLVGCQMQCTTIDSFFSELKAVTSSESGTLRVPSGPVVQTYEPIGNIQCLNHCMVELGMILNYNIMFPLTVSIYLICYSILWTLSFKIKVFGLFEHR